MKMRAFFFRIACFLKVSKTKQRKMGNHPVQTKKSGPNACKRVNSTKCSEGVGNMILEPCEFCGRKFNGKVIPKHRKICAKVSSNKRKIFDSTKQRAEALNLTANQVKQNLKKEIPIPKSNWRAKHEDFINSIRNAKKVTQALAEGKPLPPPPPPLVNADYIQCEYCERRFNKAAAERHINFCREQHQRIKSKPAPKNKVKSQHEIGKAKSRFDSSVLNFKSNSSATINSSAKLINSKSQQERSGLRRPGFTSRMPSAPSNDYNGKIMQQRTDELDNNGVNYAATGPALRTGRTGKNYTDAKRDAKAGNGCIKVVGGVGGLSMGRSAPGQRALPNSLNRTVTNRYLLNKASDSSNNSNSSNMNNSRFMCHHCDSEYPISTAKYCCECGVKRLTLS
ncbi:zinc finger C2HC domain-containing protein 1A isoform X1 [Octopus bimaculoides]|uniref:zinc finger C2HC domain-containing protein 1A isoform X1 n=3 Tax=Octopus bimaculoides TaxID=37653 RepID=UPI0022E72F98|nr:zinc finger C2HC domain-containing protein 1A isoform X1 [Octopus bimaculoides]